LSNSIPVVKNFVEAGTLVGGPFRFCTSDGEPDFIPLDSISLTGTVGDHNQWVITDLFGTTILSLPDSIHTINFDNDTLSHCNIWNVTYNDTMLGFEVGAPFAMLSGCFDRSDNISIVKLSNDGGTLTGGPITFCVGNGAADFITDADFLLEDNIGTNNQFLIVDEDGIITHTPVSLTSIDFENEDVGVSFLYNVSYDGALNGLGVNMPLDSLEGCFMLSNFIRIVKQDCDAPVPPIDIPTNIGDGPATGMKVYPNPVSEKLTLEFDTKINEAISVKVYDSYGKVHRNVMVIMDDTKYNILDTKKLSAGTYYLKVHTGRRTFVKAFVKI